MPVEKGGPSLGPTLKAGKDRVSGNMSTPIRLRKLRMTLCTKGKKQSHLRFYALYEKDHRELRLWPHSVDGESAVHGLRETAYFAAFYLAFLALGFLHPIANAQTGEWAWMEGGTTRRISPACTAR